MAPQHPLGLCRPRRTITGSYNHEVLVIQDTTAGVITALPLYPTGAERQ
jgi:hypothetical protein